MKVAAAIVAIAMLFSCALVERRACECGGGLLATRLPFGLQADWFNGTFWINDADDFGVIAPPVELQLSGGEELSVRRVRRYTEESGLIVEVELVSGDTALVDIVGAGKSIRISRLAPEALRKRAGTDVAALNWVDVRPESCFAGLYWVVRTMFAAGFVGALGVMLRSIRKRTPADFRTG